MELIFEDDNDEVGSDIEAFCPKCKGDTSHTVISKYEDEIRRVQCGVCGDVHPYRKPRGESEDDIPEPVAAKKRAQVKKPTWDEARGRISQKAMNNARLYSIRDTYREGNVVQHPVFGVGFVTEISENKVEITFKDERKVLAHNRPDLAAAMPAIAPVPGTKEEQAVAVAAAAAAAASAKKAKSTKGGGGKTDEVVEAKGEKPEKADKSEKPEKADKLDKTAKGDKADKLDKTAKAEKAEAHKPLKVKDKPAPTQAPAPAKSDGTKAARAKAAATKKANATASKPTPAAKAKPAAVRPAARAGARAAAPARPAAAKSVRAVRPPAKPAKAAAGKKAGKAR